MKYKDKIIFLITILCSTFILGSCWDYNEIDDRAILLGAAIDYDKEKDMMIVAYEIATPMQEGGETVIESNIVEGRGKNIFDATRNLVTIVGRKVLWSHAKIVIISEDVAMNKDKLLTVLDYLKRDAEPRDDIWLFISKEKTAKEILEKTNIETERIVAFNIEGIMRNEDSLSKYHGVHLWEFIDIVATEGTSPTLPSIELESYMDRTISNVYGTEVFKGIEPVGRLNGIETSTFLYIIDEIKGGIIVVTEKDDENPVKISLEVFSSKTKIKPIYSNNKITMKIDMKTVVSISEIGSDIDFINEKKRIEVKKSAEKLMEKRIQELIKKIQKEYKSDIFDFAGIIQRDNPKLWKDIKEDWDNIFSKLNIEVDVEIEIRGSSITSKPIKVRD